jgi:hypothetical protein
MYLILTTGVLPLSARKQVTVKLTVKPLLCLANWVAGHGNVREWRYGTTYRKYKEPAHIRSLPSAFPLSQQKLKKKYNSVQSRLSGKICFCCVGTIRRIRLSSDDFYLDSSLVQGPIRVEFFWYFNVLSYLSQMVCAVLDLYTLSWCWYRCPEIGTSSVYCAQLSRFYLKTETESSLRNVVFWNINIGQRILSRNIIFVPLLSPG